MWRVIPGREFTYFFSEKAFAYTSSDVLIYLYFIHIHARAYYIYIYLKLKPTC